MNTKQKIGRACMIVGILLILGALALLGYNQWAANRAAKASQDARPLRTRRRTKSRWSSRSWTRSRR